jgi:hypothetical protein
MPRSFFVGMLVFFSLEHTAVHGSKIERKVAGETADSFNSLFRSFFWRDRIQSAIERSGSTLIASLTIRLDRLSREIICTLVCAGI